MAMTVKTEGIEVLGAMLAQLGEKAQDVATGALFDGADVMADAYTTAINSIRTAPFKYARKGEKRLPSPEEKNALLGKSGIAKFNKTGDEVNTMIGISGAAGYADVAGHRKAVRLIARSINSGTSFMNKQPVFRKATSQNSGAAKNAIVSKAEQMFKEIIGG